MNNPKFESYKRPNGHDEFKEWLYALPEKDAAKLLRVIEETEKNGMLVAQRLNWAKKISSNLYEIRNNVASKIQRTLYFHVTDNRYIITHGFTKKTNQTPTAEKKHAEELRKEWYAHEN
ncbi:addiction module toxin RelE [Lacticaseibacillus chiayiensis]|uniref:Addiction module toxin RelE n=1 Tax=Lacticaseibacillus chiayiensis TaxID=2100821 RepID=A0A4Q1U6K2_9LACO|nr:type II toxin-antitoxin system RelE/ParE family toxin [Lacticaseibacillus chiayiensis]QVI35035.1 type II toxin-antitoxin system RelE/ParE family toxin [Lacticaseibacillus chiayiensis]RXT26547.1 addiction module toxin RelE [Lacticaseibacillus chiayiensis]RXT55699.1 addiction module toxin RelE [Lacticaseibacillus chiayiensis]UYN56815.1 type II toxin-antitoxin system RelE/ParE family toxin [Lacticaseibacillus chiayiensis]